ncbi:HlyD family secretion protein [Sulfuricurvum sp.]|jgi:membrane fusion protein (multidrug efflux system)|uniref:HlyD family secretion protein n=1 Tax=Sulfuricurvum sp. TaxID=2025608 RepID=UPI00260CA68B|nr:HlyD family secretion protein [Sulfuricurvum sp.]MDD2782365.1 HlyD family secretion protein [Sulfuricurvum sp.]
MKNQIKNKARIRKYMFSGGAIVLIIVSVVFYLRGGRFVSTDDAYVKAARVNISSNISGRVIKIFVKENQQVHKGDPLFELDDREYKIAIVDAKAKLANAKLQIEALEATYKQRKADVLSAEATLAYETNELKRQKNLFLSGASSQAKLDSAQHNFDTAIEKLHALKEEQNNISSLLGNNLTINIDNHPTVQQARAELEQAKLNLSYTVTKAPMDGIVSKVDQLQPGSYINAASALFSLMSQNIVWVEANFKETELAYMCAGQKAKIEVDAYPDKTFYGSVESFSSGTGSSFSLLPAENASGNWVKVVQRLPVQIKINNLDSNRPLHSGLSTVVEVDTHHSRIKDFL